MKMQGAPKPCLAVLSDKPTNHGWEAHTSIMLRMDMQGELKLYTTENPISLALV